MDRLRSESRLDRFMNKGSDAEQAFINLHEEIRMRGVVIVDIQYFQTLVLAKLVVHGRSKAQNRWKLFKNKR